MNSETKILSINIDLIIPNRFQPRLVFDEKSLNELATSIKEHGIIQPLILRKINDKYEIIAGERRYKAAIKAGLVTVPAIVVNIDDNESAEVAIVENLQRSNLNSLEEAKSFKKILDKGFLTQEKLAQRLGISQSSIANKLRLLSLNSEVQNALMSGKISERHARSLLQLENELDQINLLNRIITERLTVRQLDEIIKNYNLNSESMELKIEEDKVNDNIPSKNVISEIVEDNTFDKKEDTFGNILNLLSSHSGPSLEDEETNMNIELESDSSNEDYFNPFDSENDFIKLDDAAEESLSKPVLEVKEEVKPRIISQDLESIKLAYNQLQEEIKNAGFKISSEDFDFEDIYQLIIKIEKNEQA